jgi:hypothetical protein
MAGKSSSEESRTNIWGILAEVLIGSRANQQMMPDVCRSPSMADSNHMNNKEK